MLSICELHYQLLPWKEKADVFVGPVTGGKWMVSTESKSYWAAQDALFDAGLWRRLWGAEDINAVVAVLRFNGLSVEVEEG